MWISKGELQNVKSYGDMETVVFTRGVNAICGPNGAGKSTILEAIGFVLFDALNYKNQDQFLREGCKQGQITVTFVDAVDEREYEVVRTLGGRSPYVNDPQTKKHIVSGKQDVIDWLKDHLGVTPTTDLKSLFTDAVGIPQGMLAATFLERPSFRKAKFDPLLQVDEYETVWEKLRDTSRYLEHSKTEKELKAAALRARLSRLPELEVQKAGLVEKSAEVALELRATTEQLTSVAKDKVKYEALELRISERIAHIKQIEERLLGITKRTTIAQKDFEESKAALEAVESSQQNYLDFEAAQSQISILQAKRAERDKLAASVHKMETELALIGQRIENSRLTLDKIQKAKQKISALEPLAVAQIQLETQISNIEHQIRRLVDARSRYTEETIALERLNNMLNRVQVDIVERERIVSEIGKLENIRQSKIEEITQIDRKTSNLLPEQEKYQKNAEAARGRVMELEQSKQRLSETEDELQELEGKKREFDESLDIRVGLESELGNLRSSLSDYGRITATLQASGDQISDSQEAIRQKTQALLEGDESECPVCRQPLTPKHAEELLRDYEIELESLSRRMELIGEQRQETRQMLLSAEQSIESVEIQLSQLPAPSRGAEVEETIAAKTERASGWKADAEQLSGAKREVELLSGQLEKSVEEIGQLKGCREKLEKERLETEDLIGEGRDGLSALAAPSRSGELEVEIEQKKGNLDQANQVIGELNNAPEKQETLQRKLQDIGDPKQEIAGLSAIVLEEAQLSEALIEAQEKRLAIEEMNEVKLEELGQFGGLDLELSKQNQSLDNNQSHHEIYLSNIRAAERISERGLALESLAEEKETAANTLSSETSTLEGIQTSYDPLKHQESISLHGSLIALEAELYERHRGIEGQEIKIDSEIGSLMDENNQLRQVASQLEELSDLQFTLNFVRKTIREAGPLITRRLIQAVSEKANRIYGDIMADPSSNLSWELDYGITVDHKGESREFRQLSGGEQMAAALAVRLALLREMSGIRIAFFDEPTAHLDDSRRENLAQQISNIKGFNQLFVISHDDTFERETHHVLRVSKVNGQSHVEIG